MLSYDVFKSFAGKFISKVEVDHNDMVWATVGYYGTEDYAPYEKVYCGQWQERPVNTILCIQDSITAEYLTKWTKSALLKRKGIPKEAKISIRECIAEKVKARMVGKNDLITFLYSDHLYLSKRLCLPLKVFEQFNSRELADLEKYPAGFARYIVDKVNIIKEKLPRYTFFYPAPKSKINNYNPIHHITISKIYNVVIKNAPKKVKKCKWVCKNLTDKEVNTNLDLSNKWTFYASLAGRSITPQLVKVYCAEMGVSYRKFSTYQDCATTVQDYLEYLQRNGEHANVNVDCVRAAIRWHREIIANRKPTYMVDPNTPMYVNNFAHPGLEEFRIKTVGELRALGNECHHCIGWKTESLNTFYVKATKNRKSVVCAEVDVLNKTVIQCFDKCNKRTANSIAFAKKITEMYNDYTEHNEEPEGLGFNVDTEPAYVFNN
jgi:hypothetical protein